MAEELGIMMEELDDVATSLVVGDAVEVAITLTVLEGEVVDEPRSICSPRVAFMMAFP